MRSIVDCTNRQQFYLAIIYYVFYVLIITGQERFGNMTRVYYKDALGAFVVFDVTRPATFEAVAKWKQDLDAKVSLEDGSPIPCVLLANKVNIYNNSHWTKII